MKETEENASRDLFALESREMMKQMAKSGGVTIADHNLALLNRAKTLFELGYISRDIYDLLCKACEYHDLGKANPKMQERLRHAKLKFDSNKEIPHNVLSMYLIPKDSSKEYYIMLFAVGFHHDYGDVLWLLEDQEKRRLAEELLAQWKCARHPGRKAIKTMKSYIVQTAVKDKMILVKGLLHKCDYAASGETEIEYKNDFLMCKTNRFFEKEGYSYNDMQRFCLERQDENIIVVGQTGMGKTEAALLWIGDHKGFIFLPVKTAINKMYDRIRKEIIDDESADGVGKQLGLLHSDAVSRLLEQQEKVAQQKQNMERAAYQEMDVIAYYNRSRQLAMPLTISTVD
ncbi:MAG: CRISPR-associated endonuclease Cas3'', partial [Lachnospiraceae bacterium]|nr:CRISPR-associated endonuclease Cas3'' [Lachnospiraceae bacterium]